MDPNGVLAIIKAFFDALRSFLEAMGILEKKADSSAE